MKTFKKVEYTKASQLIFFLLSVVVVFILLVFVLLNSINFNTILSILFGTIISGVYYVLIKRKIIQISDFKIFSDNFEWNDRSINFNQIKNYKIYFLQGTARIKINLHDKTNIHLTSSESYCNSKNFISLYKFLNKSFKGYSNLAIRRKKTFLESDFGYYTAIVLTILYMIIPIHSLLSGKDFKFVSFILGIGALGTLWAGIIINRKK